MPFKTKSIAIGLLAATTLAACGSERSGEFETEDGESGTYTINESNGEATARVETEDGTMTMRSGEDVPVDLPAGFSVYPDAEVVSNTVVSKDGGQGSMIVMTSDDSPQEMAAYYRKQAEDAGIEIGMEMKISNGEMLGGGGPDGEVFTFNANTEDGVTNAQLMVGEGLKE